ncbi:spore germination protein [Alkalihalophilus sp. As8PL]|uniref:Spore germination protein n=1 Tax=Alkalihalophilus sp. As8PL TaxID=3237103 RepID=A0AB39BXN3_9BACI
MRFHKLIKKHSRVKNIVSAQQDTTEPKPEIINHKTITHLFSSCEDVIIEAIPFKEKSNDVETVVFVYSPGLADTELINKQIVPHLEDLIENNEYLSKEIVKEEWKMSSLAFIENKEQLAVEVFQGKLILFFEKLDTCYQINIAKPPQRNTEETNSEVSILGPRDGFIESISTNIALIRKRLPTSSLKYERFTIGARSQTKVGLVYIDDIINPEIVKEVQTRISKIDVDTLFSSNQLAEIISARTFHIFPIFDYTGRPDFVVNSLMRGRFAIFIDGNPTAVVGPVNLFFLLKSAEDSEYFFVYNTFERLLRLFGILIAVFLPGFWIALVTFHQDQIPILLLATLSTARAGVPLPSPVEALIMMGLFELFREAGARLPIAVGQTLTVVGGLIIGDAAIRAGLTSPGMVVVIATALVANFTLVNQSLIGVISILRFGVVIMAGFFGMFGFMIVGLMIIVYLANLRTFGIPYLTPLFPMTSLKNLVTRTTRPSWKKID